GLHPDERSCENIPHSHSASILLGRSRDLGLDRPPNPSNLLPAYRSWKTREKNPASGKGRAGLALVTQYRATRFELAEVFTTEADRLALYEGHQSSLHHASRLQRHWPNGPFKMAVHTLHYSLTNDDYIYFGFRCDGVRLFVLLYLVVLSTHSMCMLYFYLL